jgi:NAD(P)-dependent dehydrogenase (short-subunit alcohol dehydrogenase family)
MNILITGTNRGLGYYLADGFLKKGNTVFGLNRLGICDLINLKAAFPALYHPYRADVSDEKAVIRAFKKISARVPHIDILINNAAVHLEPSPSDNEIPDMKSIDFGTIKKTIDVNSCGPLRVVKHFIPLVLKGTGKLIVNISSEAGSIGKAWRKGEYGYCMSKAALNMASMILQNRFASEGVKVLAIHPGWMKTDMGGEAAPTPPEQSASAIIQLTEKEWKLDGPVFIDTEGKQMEW